MAGGPWSPYSIGVGRPGLFINFLPSAIAAITPGQRGTCATVIKSAWGPDLAVQAIYTNNDVINFYSTNEVSPNNSYYSLKSMFDGGALKILAYRIVGTGAAVATKNIQDTQGSPATAITLNGKYKGIRANNFFVQVQANAGDGTKTDVLLYEGTFLLAQWTNTNVNRGVAGHMADIVATINADANNYYVVATLVGADSGALFSTPTSIASPGAAMTGGNDGAAPVAQDYTNAMNALEAYGFDVFTCDVIDAEIAGIGASIKSWIKGQRAYGKYVRYVSGSALAESAGTAQTNASAINAEYATYVYPGVKQLNYLGTLVTRRGAAFAAQIAGAESSLNPGDGLTYFPLQNVIDLENRPNNPTIVSLLAAGVMPLVYDGQIFKVEKGITTLVNTTTSVPGKTLPNSFKKVSVVNTVDAIANAVTASANANYIGKVRNDEQGQKALLTVIRDFLQFMAGQRAIRNGFTVILDPNYSSVDDKVFVAIGMTPTDTMDYIYFTVTIG